jgi:hypothetical protein
MRMAEASIRDYAANTLDTIAEADAMNTVGRVIGGITGAGAGGAGGGLLGGATGFTVGIPTGPGEAVAVPVGAIAGAATGAVVVGAAGVYVGEDAEEGAKSIIQMMANGTRSGSAKGASTEPTLPPKTLASEGDVRVEQYYRSGDHPPAHAHVKGGGESTRIGPNGKPLAGQPELTGPQRAAVDANKATIRSAVNKIGRWLKFQENK